MVFLLTTQNSGENTARFFMDEILQLKATSSSVFIISGVICVEHCQINVFCQNLQLELFINPTFPRGHITNFKLVFSFLSINSSSMRPLLEDLII